MNSIRRFDYIPRSRRDFALKGLWFLALSIVPVVDIVLPAPSGSQDPFVTTVLGICAISLMVIALLFLRVAVHPGGDGVEIDANGFRSTRPGARWVPWSEVAGLRQRGPRVPVEAVDTHDRVVGVFSERLEDLSQALNLLKGHCMQAYPPRAVPFSFNFGAAPALRSIDIEADAIVLNYPRHSRTIPWKNVIDMAMDIRPPGFNLLLTDEEGVLSGCEAFPVPGAQLFSLYATAHATWKPIRVAQRAEVVRKAMSMANGIVDFHLPPGYVPYDTFETYDATNRMEIISSKGGASGDGDSNYTEICDMVWFVKTPARFHDQVLALIRPKVAPDRADEVLAGIVRENWIVRDYVDDFKDLVEVRRTKRMFAGTPGYVTIREGPPTADLEERVRTVVTTLDSPGGLVAVLVVGTILDWDEATIDTFIDSLRTVSGR